MSASDIEAEVARRVAGYRLIINDLQEANRRLEFRAAVAEWAVAGVLARNTHIEIAVNNPLAAERASAVEGIGRQAGIAFLYQAELEFRLHAEHSQLKANAGIHYRPSIEESVPHPIMWPRPFK